MNFSRLAGLNLSFDAQIYSHQASDLARLASENPDTTIILDHACMPHDQSAEGLSEWRSAVEQLAEMPNICIKISGFGMVDNQWTPDSVVPLIRHCVDSFGCKRSMFGSNFPVDKLMSSWDRLWQTFALSVKDKSKDEQEWMFSRTAETVYRI
jgi:predicted TIM-barrel fold metal-dependent hydrolase